MGIELGGAEFFVAEHLLDGAQVGTAFKKMGSKGVAESVRGDIFLYAGTLHIYFEIMKHGNATHALAPLMADKEHVLFAAFYVDFVALLEPQFYFFYGAMGQGHEALFVALAYDADETFVEEKVGDFQTAQFAYAET